MERTLAAELDEVTRCEAMIELKPKDFSQKAELGDSRYPPYPERCREDLAVRRVLEAYAVKKYAGRRRRTGTRSGACYAGMVKCVQENDARGW